MGGTPRQAPSSGTYGKDGKWLNQGQRDPVTGEVDTLTLAPKARDENAPAADPAEAEIKALGQQARRRLQGLGYSSSFLTQNGAGGRSAFSSPGLLTNPK